MCTRCHQPAALTLPAFMYAVCYTTATALGHAHLQLQRRACVQALCTCCCCAMGWMACYARWAMQCGLVCCQGTYSPPGGRQSSCSKRTTARRNARRAPSRCTQQQGSLLLHFRPSPRTSSQYLHPSFLLFTCTQRDCGYWQAHSETQQRVITAGRPRHKCMQHGCRHHPSSFDSDISSCGEPQVSQRGQWAGTAF